jgi:hypothetical protein
MGSRHPIAACAQGYATTEGTPACVNGCASQPIDAKLASCEALAVGWRTMCADVPSGTRFEPPGNVHAPFYPLKGPYSSSDPAVVRAHIQEMQDVNVTVLVSVHERASGELFRHNSSCQSGELHNINNALSRHRHVYSHLQHHGRVHEAL